jgi:undecaprenyl-phosphate galactose phosphotransferase
MVIILFTYLTLISILSKSLIESILKNIGLITKNVVIVGLDDTAIKIATSILKKTLPNSNILFFVDKQEGKIKIENQEFDVKKLQNIKRLIILNKNIDTIIISEGAFEKEEAEDIILKINSLFKEIIIVPNLKLWNVLNLEHVPAYTLDILMLKSKNNLKSVFSNILKYCFDYVIIIILIPILIIVIPIIALLIKLDSKGPVFYIQERIGKNGKIFKVIKFRTMYINSQEILEKFLQENKDALLEWQTYKKLKSYDPRVTRVGRFLRKTSLDELPQIFNVIKGEMSLVGPRPYLPSEAEDMGDYKDYILLTRPGITGLWQISGRSDLSFEERLKLDTWYVLNWSLWLDLYIILKTFLVVLSKKGAY